MSLGFVTVALLNGECATVYIREYDPNTLQARVMVQGNFIKCAWNGAKWVQVN
jgi:hypothetical protein